ncbi:MAG: diacylglycerol kinase [Pseudoalteromonas sp.]|nr:diacylglycerol kinase [Pseudoalteromonas sp.]|tara:strand:+ start:951 stop:1334 length:384 start_codon:yes stop_codon:yes gene_type:complete
MLFDNTNKPKGLKRLFLALGHSFRAFTWLSKNEAAFRQEIVLLLTTLTLLPFLSFSSYDNLLIVSATLFVMFAEIMNTAIEAVVDRIGLEIHELSGLAKDLGSACVTIALVILSLVWLVVLYSNFVA